MTDPSSSLDLCVAIIVCDAQRTIEQTIRSVNGLARRVLVVDSGSTDGTQTICRELGAEAIFVGSGLFKSDDPAARAKAIVHANTHWKDEAEVLNANRGLKAAMDGIEMETLADPERLANRGW